MSDRQIALLLNKLEMAEFICCLIEAVERYVRLTPDSEFCPDREFYAVLLDESLYPDNSIMKLVLEMRHNR